MGADLIEVDGGAGLKPAPPQTVIHLPTGISS
jgi:hypothetical protein